MSRDKLLHCKKNVKHHGLCRLAPMLVAAMLAGCTWIEGDEPPPAEGDSEFPNLASVPDRPDPSVLEEDSPFHNLFPGKSSSHLFVSSFDGTNRVPLESETSRTELWKAMTASLRSEYKKDPRKPLKVITGLLDDHDLVDDKLGQLEAKELALLEKDGPKAPKLKKIRRDMDEAVADLKELSERVRQASELELKPTEK